jgi:hypothetical protein
MLLIFCSYLFLSFYQENIAAYAYVGIDINPSIELALNKKGIIIGSRGLDDEGKELLEKINIKKMDSVEGVKQIIAKTIDMNYLDKNESNEITLYAIMEKENNQNGNELIEKMENAIKEEVVAHSIDGKINAFVSDKEVKDKADKMGVSVGQYISKKAKTTKAEDKVAKYKKDKNDKADKAAEYKKDREDRIAEYKKIKEDRAAEYKKDKADKDAELVMVQELPIHQVFDLMILLSRTLLYFKEAYRLPLLYDPEKPTVDRIGVQGGVLPVEICTDNENINEDIREFAQSLNDLGELIGERQRTLIRILDELELY